MLTVTGMLSDFARVDVQVQVQVQVQVHAQVLI